MKKSFLIKAATLVLSLVCAFGFVGCNKTVEEEAINAKLPDYSSRADSYEFFAYVSPGAGTFTTENGTTFLGEDFRSEARYRDYMECGMDMVMARYENSYSGEDWETSNAKKVCDAAYAAGCRKIILSDNRIDYLVNSKLNPSDGSGELKTEEALDAKVEEYLSSYKDVPGLYGLCLRDEPNYSQIDALGKVYKSIKRVAAKMEISDDFYLHTNLFPMSDAQKLTTYWNDVEAPAENLQEAYTRYAHKILEVTGANRIAVDIYPFVDGKPFGNYFFSTLQILRKECDEHNANLTLVMESFNYYKNGKQQFDVCDKACMYLSMNAALAYGVDDMAYFTYFPKPSYDYDETASLVDFHGNKNSAWYYAQEMIAEAQSLSDILLNYDFKGSKIYTKTPSNNGTACYTTFFDNSYTFNLLQNAEFDNDALLVTEAYDSVNELYMYTAENIISPKYDGTDMNVTLGFGEEYNYVAVLECGEIRYEKLSGGKYSTVLSAGYAQHLIPLK